MSNFLLTIVRSNRILNIFQQKLAPSIHSTTVLNLYSPTALGLDGYILTRKRTKEQFFGHMDKLRAKMAEFITDPKHMIFTEDLRNIVHLAEPTDLELVLNMVKKFNTQNTDFRFGSFKFGPVAMRLFHFLDAPTEALQTFEDPANEGFYDQQTSYHILLDLLYKHQMYDEMYRIFDKIQQKQINMTKFPKYPVVLILAACYKQNTPKSFEYAKKIWLEMVHAGVSPLRRASTLIAGLALKQGAPQIALEVMSQQIQQHYVTVRNIKAVALADLGRLDDVMPVLRQVLDIDRPTIKDKHTFFEETISKVSEAVNKSNNEDVKKEFEQIARALRERELVDSQTLEKLLLSEITVNVKKPQDRGIGNQSRQWNPRSNPGGYKHNMV